MTDERGFDGPIYTPSKRVGVGHLSSRDEKVILLELHESPNQDPIKIGIAFENLREAILWLRQIEHLLHGDP